MNKDAKLRIVSDIMSFEKEKFNNMFINYEDGIKKIHAMIIGPKNTPYFGGYLFFVIIFPDNYPKTNPFVKFLTINNKVRIHPNLYANGKVCLSTLGTWPGKKWEPVNTLTSLLISISSLLNDLPIRNEPGYENIKEKDPRSICFNNYVIYNTYHLLILQVLKNKFEVSKKFTKPIKAILKENYEELKNNILSYKEILGKYLVHESIYYGIKEKELDFDKLCENFLKTAKV